MICKIKPYSHRLIIEERPPMKKVGMIEMPEEVNRRAQVEATEGMIICMAPDAFDYLEEDQRPKLNDVVHFIKYDGIGKCYNKRNYRILLDESIWGSSSKYIQLDEDLIANNGDK
jgi:co-chaperonin GroES (HSP10)